MFFSNHHHPERTSPLNFKSGTKAKLLLLLGHVASAIAWKVFCFMRTGYRYWASEHDTRGLATLQWLSYFALCRSSMVPYPSSLICTCDSHWAGTEAVRGATGQATIVLCMDVYWRAKLLAVLYETQLPLSYRLFRNIGKGFNSNA